MLGGELTLAYYFVDELFYWEGLVCLFIGYFLLLAFWAAIINKHGASTGWFTAKMRKIVIVFVFLSVTILSTIPFVDSFAPVSLSNWPGIVNGIVLLYLLIFSIASIVKGVQVLRLIRSFEVKDQKIIRIVTWITTVASTSMVLRYGFTVCVLMRSLIVFAIFTVVILRSPDFYICQSGFVVFSALELVVVTSIIAPLSTAKRDTSTSTELPTSYQHS